MNAILFTYDARTYAVWAEDQRRAETALLEVRDHDHAVRLLAAAGFTVEVRQVTRLTDAFRTMPLLALETP